MRIDGGATLAYEHVSPVPRQLSRPGSDGKLKRRLSFRRAARLRSTERPRGVAVHPAELDGALQLGGALAPVGPAADGATATRLPFGVDESLVRRGADEASAGDTTTAGARIRRH